MTITRYIVNNIFYSALAFLLILSSCRTEEFLDSADEADLDATIRFSARITEPQNTRDNVYIESGEVKQGSFGIFYQSLTHRPNLDYSRILYDQGFVDFGNEEGPTTGFAYYIDEGRKKDLKWRHVFENGISNVSFILHNIPNIDTYKWDRDKSLITFNNNYPFKTGPLDKETGSNDFLFGNAQANNKTGEIYVDMEHILSLLQINIEVYGSEDEEPIDLSYAHVTLDSVYTSLTQYTYHLNDNYYKIFEEPGTNFSPARSQLQGLKKVDLVESDPFSNIYWEETTDMPDKLLEDIEDSGQNEYRKKVYKTKEFVLPPQPASNKTNKRRPILTIKVPKTSSTADMDSSDSLTFYGSLPDVMFQVDENGNQSLTPQNLEFLTGRRLTITASINSPHMELQFSPVKVEGWTNRGTFNLVPRQAGIYTANEFKTMMSYYNKKNYEELERFGYWDEENNFVVQFWASINLERDEIKKKMENDSENFVFYFIFNGFSVNLTDNGNIQELYDSDGEEELYSIVTGKDKKEFKGIESLEDFQNLLRRLNSSDDRPTIAEIRNMGSIINGDNSILFKIRSSFDLDFNTFFRKFPSKYLNKSISFIVEGDNKVDLLFPSSEIKKQIFSTTSTGEYNYLDKFVLNDIPRVSSEFEYELLYDSYTKYYNDYNDILNVFGTRSNDSWIFEFYDAFTLDGNRVFLKMIPNDTNGPEFSTRIRSGCIITIEDDKTPCKVTSSSSSVNMDALLRGNGSTDDSSSAISNLASNYTSSASSKDYGSLWRVGKFENGKWDFQINIKTSSNSYVSYSNIFEKMIPDETSGKYDYDFHLVNPLEVRSVPTELSGLSDTTFIFSQEGDNSSLYPNDAVALKKMADGTYWEYYEEWKLSNSN